jgi:hypothetical protein
MREEFPDDEEFDVIPAAELESTKNAMNLTELKTRPAAALVQLAETMGLENLARSRKQDIIFSILKSHAKNGESIFGEGVLEILQDGFGFLRSSDGSYLAGPDDIYVSPSQIRRFNLRTGDTVSGLIRPPKDGERYFALLKVGEINHDAPENAKSKVLFENLTPLFPKKRLKLEQGNGSTEDLTARIIDMTARERAETPRRSRATSGACSHESRRLGQGGCAPSGSRARRGAHPRARSRRAVARAVPSPRSRRDRAAHRRHTRRRARPLLRLPARRAGNFPCSSGSRARGCRVAP